MAQVNGAQREPSMEEILASIRRIIEDSDTTRLSEGLGAERASHIDIALPPTSEEGEANPSPFVGEMRLRTVEAKDFSSDPEPEEFEELNLDAADFSVASEADEEEPEHESEVTPAEPETRSTRGALASPETSREVAASLGNLSEALTARGRRTFDEIAEEMLRPMLQDWLDNNLPHLVERLVREEIERIARGGMGN